MCVCVFGGGGGYFGLGIICYSLVDAPSSL